MAPPNSTWQQILVQARANPEVLKQTVSAPEFFASQPVKTTCSCARCAQEVIKSIQNVLQTNVSVCTSLGQPFATQFNVIYGDMLQVSAGA